ncbi:hypothetical protein V2J94_22040 [Streptomyces sp. DSM 41524]|uniref:Transferase n=1 Tax=Streptomyces asiaticus subsp. ignotus TaxID=3098222 RepID=A0ABU7PZJ4_9ACTN|nr:hypothetical protein [Streptomyces sp. DASNCL29]MEE4594531.1 hypothetical protein [Streptomyces sp. DSM 41524]TMU97868.1 hypothetical protein FGK60_08355 [Streptomyces sp. DASNCL29]
MSEAAEAAPARADCVADSAGGLTFHIADWARPAPGGHDDWSGALVLIRRGAKDAPDGEVRLPLGPTADGRLQAALPSNVALPEGRWDVHVAYRDAEPRRLAPGLNDLRSLVDRRPGPSTSPLSVRIPYATKHGNLSLRSWRRAPHAEAGEIRLEDDTMAVRGRLYRVAYPSEWLADAVVEARRRGGEGPVRTAPLEVEGPDFSFTLSYADLARTWGGGADVWDLWLRPADRTMAPARLARILDDVADKKEIFTYPPRTVAGPHGEALARPYYTRDNDLAVRIEALA